MRSTRRRRRSRHHESASKVTPAQTSMPKTISSPSTLPSLTSRNARRQALLFVEFGLVSTSIATANAS